MRKIDRTKLIVALYVLVVLLFMTAIITLSVIEIDAHKHEYSTQVIAQTCTDDGYTLHTCACGNNYKDEIVNALGHDYAEEFTVDLQPDCTEDGSKSRHCTRCESTTEVTAIPANGHAYGKWETVAEKTCTERGVNVRTCGICGHDEADYEDSLGHDIEYITDEYYHQGECNRCDFLVQRVKHIFEETVCADCEYEVHPTQGLEYELNDDGASYSVKGIGKANDATELVIFSTYNGLPVTSVKKIDYRDANNVTSIIIYDNVKELNGYAFSHLTKLTNVLLPSTLTNMDPSAFSFCTGLKEIDIDSANPVYHSVDGKFVIDSSTKTLFLSVTNEIPADGSVTSIGNYAFSGRFSHKGIIIPDTIIFIGDYAFEYCRYFDFIEIPSSVKSIGDGAFLCTDIKSVILNDGLMSIGDDAFRAAKLNEIFIPKSVKQIGKDVFGECRLNSIAVDNQNFVYHSVGNCLIETQTKTLIAGCAASVVPDDGSVTSIGDYAFFSAYELVSIELPDSISSIGECAFAHNNHLETIVISENLKLIDEAAFLNCTNLKELKYSGSVKQWNAIEKKRYIGHSWDYYFPSDYRIICKDGIITMTGVVPI